MSNYLTPADTPVTLDALDRAAHQVGQHKRASGYRIQAGQRFHRAGYTAVVWRVMSVYRDAQGLEHATLVDESGRLDEKTLSASVLLDRGQYRAV